MAYSAKVLADSMSPDGFRLTSFEVTMPRIVLAELNTHRALSRNSASSRAIPVEKMLKKVEEDPFLPVYWGKNERGMSASEEFTGEATKELEDLWTTCAKTSMWTAKELMLKGVHKQITNRLLEPWLWHTIIITASELTNFFNLRRDKNAQPEIRKGADLLWAAFDSSVPDDVGYGQWHLPLVRGVDLPQLLDEGYTAVEIAQISCGRCARVSYLTHDGKRDPKADIAMSKERLVPSGHMSPLEHGCRPMSSYELEIFTQKPYKVVNVDGSFVLEEDFEGKPRHFLGNIEGWVQMRKLIPGEAVFRQMQL